MSADRFPALIFAAGFGTRMKNLTQDRPKPLIKVAGKPLIDHALALVKDAQCDPIVANLHYKADMLVSHLRPKGVRTITEQPDVLETGGGLRNALPLLGQGPILTLNPDVIWAGPNPIRLLEQVWQPDEMDALLICIPVKQTVGYNGSGDFSLSDTGKIARGGDVVYGCCQIIKTDLLAEIKETKFSLNLVWDQMIKRDRLYGLPYPGRWCDVGHPAGIKQAENMLDSHHV